MTTHGGARSGAGRKQSIFRPSNSILGYLDEMIKGGLAETRAQALDIAFLLLFQVRPLRADNQPATPPAEDKETNTMHRTNRNQLRIAYRNGLDLYLTPGSQTCYWNSRPTWQDDKVAATVEDFTDTEGFEFDPEDTEADDNDIFTANI